MSEPGAPFARAWRERIAAALDGTWSSHSGLLPEQLSRLDPASVRVEPEASFFPFPATTAGLAALLAAPSSIPPQALSMHLWAHLWWERGRRDFSEVHGGRYLPSFVRHARTTLAEATRPYLPQAPARQPAERWSYLSLDEESGYGVAAERCIAALEGSGVDLDWTPFVPGRGWGLAYEPARGAGAVSGNEIVVAHLVPEYLPAIRARQRHAFLVAHTAWETDRIPKGWVGPLSQADLIVVPSRFGAEVIGASAVAVPVAVVPHVAPTVEEARPAAVWADVPDDAFVFYTVAEWTERKNVLATVEAYLCAFEGDRDVLLVVKTTHRDLTARPSLGRRAAGVGTSAWSLARLLGAHANPPAVKLVTRTLTPAEVAALHRRGDCYVSLARGEGWGLGSFDAAAHGNPVVTTGFGGQLDYLSESPYLVRYHLVAVEDPGGFPSYAPDQQWAAPDVDHAAALLREIAAQPAQARDRAASIAADLRLRFSPAAVAASFRDTVRRHHSSATGRSARARGRR